MSEKRKSSPTKSTERSIYTINPDGTDLQKSDSELLLQTANDKAKTEGGYLESILKSLKDSQDAQRIAFEVDPYLVQGAGSMGGGFGSAYIQKTKLTPDWVIKALTGPGGDELLNQILQARSNVIASFGRPKSDRFSVGFEFIPINKSNEFEKDAKQASAVKDLIEKAKEVMWNCGHPGLEEDQATNLSQFFKMIVRDGLRFGRCAIEMIYARDPLAKGGEKLHSFRPVDSGTIYRIKPRAETEQSVRTAAIKLLEELKNEKIDASKYEKDEYKWLQVIENKPTQAFTDKELVVYNFYPVTNVEYSGYPLTPIDQAISAIMTHINITLHNKLYFQNGRATKGILVFNSDNMDETSAQKIRLQFNQTINGVANSHRLPVFVVGEDEKVSWQSIDASGRDMEFQYLMDMNSRIIMGAFQMSPDELPGYNHLSRGSNTQALSESNNEYKMTAARDTGLRPLIYDIQDLINSHIFPKFFGDLSETHQLILSGLDKDDPEKESTRLQQDMAVHMTYNDVLKKVEKDPLPTELGGDFPLNPQYQQVVEKYLTVGEIMENFFGKKGAAVDPRHQWYANPMWMQQQQMLVQQAQIAMQNQMMAQQMVQQAQSGGQPQPGEEGGDPSQSGGDQGPPGETPAQKNERLNWLNIQVLNKSIKDNHTNITRMILARHEDVSKKQIDAFEKESKKSVDRIVAHLPKKKKK
jgi:hypothetical protein